MNYQSPILLVLYALSLAILLFATSLLPAGSRDIGSVETIQGTPFVIDNDAVSISESLAHMDVYLREPVLAKSLVLKFDYLPETPTPLVVGVRENPFWLSYQPTTFYTGDRNVQEWQYAEITIPLTDKLQETDRSLDVMFMAISDQPLPHPDPVNDPTSWQLRNVRAEVIHSWPNRTELRDYVRSVLKRERAL